MTVADTAEAWWALDPDPDTRAELRALLEAGDEAELTRRFAGRLHGRELMRFSGKILVAAACMAAVCWGARLTLLAGWTGYGLPLRILTLGATIAVAAGVYFGVSVLLRNHEVEDIRRRVLRALSRGK